jgi:TonB family protein
LLGSIIFHMLVITGVGVSLPMTPGEPEKTAYFQLVSDASGAGKPARRDGLKSALPKGTGLMAGKTGADSAGPKPTHTPKRETVMVKDDLISGTGKSVTENTQGVTAPASDDGSSQPGVKSGTSSGIPGESRDASGFGSSDINDGASGNPGDGKLVILPRRIHAPKPDYPPVAKKNNWQGVTILRALIKTDGTIGAISVFQSSGYDVLDRSALKTVKTKWRYQPALRRGTPVEWRLLIPVRFELEE